LVGCGSSAVLMNDYDVNQLYGKNITIIKLFDRPIIANTEDVINNLGPGVPDEVYTSFFNENIRTAFKKSNSFDSIYYLKQFPQAKLEERILNINSKNKMKIYLPKENTTLVNDSITSDFIIFLDKLQISQISASSGMYGGPYSVFSGKIIS
jgi:hypothetical protein